MTLLCITLAGDSLPRALGDWPLIGPRLGLTLDPALTLASATSAVRLALREGRTPWVLAQGKAVAPFLSAVGADLSLSVAGAFLLAPQPWSTRTLDLAPLPFPSALVATLSDTATKAYARAWGAILLPPDGLFAQPQARVLIDRRSHDLARSLGSRAVGRTYAAVAGSAPG